VTAVELTAAQVELRRVYRVWYDQFRAVSRLLDRIVAEDFPNPDDEAAEPTRYDVDAMRDLAGQLGALVVGRERE
jgi:hypothetical protein